MQIIYPDAIQIPFEGADGGSYTAGPFRGILHTTESERFHPSTKEYYGHKNPPHFTLYDGQLYQHFPINRAARALANPAGGVQTNRRSAIQIEICWTAKSINDMPEANWSALARWMRWVEAQTGIKRTAPVFGDSRQYGIGNALELTPSAWKSFNGWCGHQHVPENAHWDPGPISEKWIDYLGLNRVVAPKPKQKGDGGIADFLKALFSFLR